MVVHKIDTCSMVRMYPAGATASTVTVTSSLVAASETVSQL
jgi:hypothetical protein